jgi:hypothetical protein
MSLSNPNAERICCSLDLFSIKSCKSRFNESDLRSKLLICLVYSLSFSDKVLSLSSNSLSCPIEEPEVEIKSCSFCLKRSKISRLGSFCFSYS